MGVRLWRMLGLWLPPVLALSLIFYFSSQSRLPEYLNGFTALFGTKPLHVLGYFTLAATLLRAFHGGFRHLRLQPTLFALVTLLLIGNLDEAHQGPIPGRHAEVKDVFIDLIGFPVALLGSYLYFRLFWRDPALNS